MFILNESSLIFAKGFIGRFIGWDNKNIWIDLGIKKLGGDMMICVMKRLGK